MALRKTTMWLDTDTLAWFQRRYKRLGTSKAVRALMARHARAIEHQLEGAQIHDRGEIELTDSDLAGLGDLEGDNDLGPDEDGPRELDPASH